MGSLFIVKKTSTYILYIFEFKIIFYKHYGNIVIKKNSLDLGCRNKPSHWGLKYTLA